MKPEILILLTRDFTMTEIQNMTGYSKPLIYYYNKQYKKGIQKIRDIQNKGTKEKEV